MPQVTIYKGTSKKTGNEFKAIRVEVGEWSQLIFPKSNFEMDYIEKKLAEANKEDASFNLDED